MRTRDIAELAFLNSFQSRANPTVVEPHIEIHQQPHDAADAARLYGELERKAREAILEIIPVENNLLRAKVAIWTDFASDGYSGRVFMELNGHLIKADHTMTCHEARGSHELYYRSGQGGVRHAMLKELVSKLYRRIAEEAVIGAINGEVKAP